MNATPPLGRLQCRCTFTESAAELKKRIDALPMTNPSYQQLKAALDACIAEHQKHVTEHNAEYARALVEYARVDRAPILKTTAFTSGDVREARNPVKKPTKAKKRRV